MRKEKILLYIKKNKIYLYLTKKKREIIDEVDTSLFFENGEIKNVKECAQVLRQLFQRIKILGNIIKFDIDVLYNDVTSCDLQELYNLVLSQFEPSNVSFTPISSQLTNKNEYKRIIYYDGSTYTSFYNKRKSIFEEELDYNAIIVGKCDSKYIHYTDEDMIWNEYKRDFTNR